MSARDEFPREPVGVSPRVDCVFKALMGDPARSIILIDFLNAVIAPAVPITSVEIKNPIHLPDYIGDNYTVVDVRATDADGQVFQIEMQSWNETALKERVLFTWADLYEGQITSGQGYNLLKPVISIWILDENTLRNAPHFHHRFVVCDPARQVQLTRHLEIHTLELAKWRSNPSAASPQVAAWMTFFAEAETWADLPPALHTPPLEEAMAVLQEFKNNAEWNDLYRCRLDGLRRQLTSEHAMAEALEGQERERAEKEAALAALDRERADKERALADKERALADKEQALAELEQLRALLAARA